jgi:predicted DNA binding CopG/RHH family protein
MGRVGARKKRIPTFRSDREEREFWARHSVEDFAEDLDDLNIEIGPPRTEQIALRLSEANLQVLRSLAAARGVGHTTLARTVLEEWLARSRGRTKEARRRPVHRPA